MNLLTACPENDSLERYVLGRVSDEESQRLAAHLQTCGRCLSLLPSLDRNDDLVAALRAQKRKPRPKNALIDRLCEQLRRLPGDGPSTTSHRPDSTPPPHAPPAGSGDLEEARAILSPAQGPAEVGRLGGYRVLKVLGAGGMGVVFQAEDVSLRRMTALKVMRPALAASPDARRRFLREAQAMAALASDHVVTIYQVGEDRGFPFLAMQLLLGETLEARLRRQGKLPTAEVLRIGREIALGLAAAHERGLIHRDVKPANLWLEAPDGRVKVLDFGLARPTDVNGLDVGLTASGGILGTPGYMAPEQVEGKADHRADLFSLGCVLYRMATGRPPFEGATPLHELRNVAIRQPDPASRLNAETPAVLSDLIQRLLAKNRDDRPSSARAVADALEAMRRSAPAVGPTVSIASPAPQGRTTAPTKGRRRLLVGLAAAGLLLAGLAGAGVFLAAMQPPPRGKDGPAASAQPPADKDGKPKPGDNDGPAEPPAGAAMFPSSFVSRPQKIKGLARWDIGTDAYLGATAGLAPSGLVPSGLAVKADGRLLFVDFKDPVFNDTRNRFAWDDEKKEVAPAPFQGKYDDLASDGKSGSRLTPSAVEIWEVGDTEPRLKLPVQSAWRTKWSPDGTRVAVCDQQQRLTLWDVNNFGQLWTFKDHKCGDLAWSADGKSLAVVNVDSELHGATLLDAAKGGKSAPLAFTVKRSVYRQDNRESVSVSVSSAGDVLAFTTDRDYFGLREDHGVVVVWAGKPPQALDELKDQYGARAVCSPDGKCVAYAGKDDGIRVYDVEKKEVVRTLKGHSDTVNALAFSPDGKVLASAGDDQTVRFWDAETGLARGVLVLQRDGQWLAVSADGHYSASPKAKFYFVASPEGDEKTRNLTPADFAAKYGWVNDPDKVRLFGK